MKRWARFKEWFRKSPAVPVIAFGLSWLAGSALIGACMFLMPSHIQYVFTFILLSLISYVWFVLEAVLKRANLKPYGAKDEETAPLDEALKVVDEHKATSSSDCTKLFGNNVEEDAAPSTTQAERRGEA